MTIDELTLSLFLGIGLSAACGLRVFIPILVASIGATAGYLHPSDGFAWIGSPSALTIIAIAAGVEFLAYFVSKTERFFELVATPAAMVAGTMLMAATIKNVNPLVGLVVPLLVGGGVGGLSQSLVSLMRLPSATAAGGSRRMLAGAAEAAGSMALSALAIFVPLPGFLIVLAVFVFQWKKVREAVTR